MTDGRVRDPAMSSTLSTALVILLPQRLPPTVRPAASIDGVSGPAASPVMQPAISASTFSLDGLNITATKVRLMQQAGKEFGVDQTDYESVSSYGSAIKSAVEALKRQSPAAVAKIERQLGLDQLGVSLDTLVNAIVRPQGGESDRLDAALKRHASGEGDQPDELGLYSL
ncbi:hypothetical protein EJ069_11800 [Mesorhizobium sp. M2A.F.Ca.ET.043.05.1.1]|uniref:hypothetical protein n=1 Tax=Mesorhizobium sp. M2A.F.Ca.ET.043.05.1.1 TaxID=2493671 RepID=UPI000F74E492|nr:hypothetical protein [Mesorhizobium sp. M2A.F.Ca.ET.043.05.1.1]AZO15350.1 hypothetical protein EJ069_11800 [Mesorhizobium sp. M2A.F.Ca.ET.043.05.1.1]